jgi:hypothetical protein
MRLVGAENRTNRVDSDGASAPGEREFSSQARVRFGCAHLIRGIQVIELYGNIAQELSDH